MGAIGTIESKNKNEKSKDNHNGQSEENAPRVYEIMKNERNIAYDVHEAILCPPALRASYSRVDLAAITACLSYETETIPTWPDSGLINLMSTAAKEGVAVVDALRPTWKKSVEGLESSGTAWIASCEGRGFSNLKRWM